MIEDFRQGILSATGPVLIIEDGSPEVRRRSQTLASGRTRWVIGEPFPTAGQPWGGVALLVRDRQSLRRAVSALPPLGPVAQVWCWVEDCGGWAPSLLVRPEWPRIKSLSVRTAVAGFAEVHFAARAPARDVLIGVARGSSSQRNLWSGQPLLAASRAQARLWLPASPDSLTADDPAAPVTVERALAADAVLVQTPDGLDGPAATDPHPSTGRPVTPVFLGRPASWDELDLRAPLHAGMQAPSLDPLSVSAVDERLINPVGFERDWSHGVVALQASLRSPAEVTVQLPNGRRIIDLRAGVKDSDVQAMRGLQGVELTWRGGHGPQAYVRLVAALAMAGIPIPQTVVPRWAAGLLDAGLVRELEAPSSLADRLSREERSVRLRRAGLRGHSITGWRRRLARTHGLPEPRPPRVSVLLASRRAEMLPFALRQVAKQQDVSGEVLLATHGFEPDGSVTAILDDVPGWDLHVCPQPESLPFGTILNRAAQRATGDVLLKMDDDDWYGPQFIADLLRARAYSGAEIVGTPAEFIFLAPLWTTVRRPDSTERYTPIVAGGTIMIDRTTFAEVGGFRPVRRAVDAGLLAAVREGGGSVYRSHGLGYLLRRGARGHTWDPGIGYFLTSARVSAQWHGFRPSSELVSEGEDLPTRAQSDVGTTTGGCS